MFECLIVGDSIAVGIAQYRTECKSDAKVGRRANQQKNISDISRTVIVSIGSNDGDNLQESEIKRIRNSIIGNVFVFWILPSNSDKARSIITRVALEVNDNVIDAKPFVSRDNIHPTSKGYQILANICKINYKLTL